jgi:hypothetical protein
MRLKFHGYLGKDEMLESSAVRSIFKKRHRLGVFGVVMPFIFLLIAFGLVIGKVLDKNFAEIVIVPVVFLCIVVIFLYLHFIYRCPKCGAVPRSSVRGTIGVIPFPKKCWQCDSSLLLGHRWGQD